MRGTKRLCVLVIAAAGCSGGLTEFPTAKVTGKVVCDGKPVPFVRVYFAPTGQKSGQLEVGKQGQGNADSDGVFAISTYGTHDGAVVGKHRVMVSTPHPEDIPEFFCDCVTDGNKVIQEVEVTAGGENNFTITLPAKKDKSKSSFDANDLEDVRESEKASAKVLNIE